jgi:hypothetical protein
MDTTAGLTQALQWVQEARPLYTSLRSSGSIKNNIGEKKKENEELNQYKSLFRAIPTLGSLIGKPTLLVDARIPYGATVDIAKRNIRNTNGL